jgi:hypothetical protein
MIINAFHGGCKRFVFLDLASSCALPAMFLRAFIFRAGVDGRTCIKKALCEAAQRLKVGASLWEEIMRVIFT